MVDDWKLPAKSGVDLDEGEIVLLDWVMCSASGLIPQADLDTLVKAWGALRLRAWAAYEQLGGGVQVAHLALDEYELKALLAVVPTTFRWGTGPDVGLSLKKKIAKELMK